MEYPKAVYPNGTFSDERDDDGQVLDFRTVNSPEEEEAAKADGYFAFGTVTDSHVETERDRLAAQAASQGIAVKGNWGVKKLKEVLGI